MPSAADALAPVPDMRVSGKLPRSKGRRGGDDTSRKAMRQPWASSTAELVAALSCALRTLHCLIVTVCLFSVVFRLENVDFSQIDV